MWNTVKCKGFDAHRSIDRSIDATNQSMTLVINLSEEMNGNGRFLSIDWKTMFYVIFPNDFKFLLFDLLACALLKFSRETRLENKVLKNEI